MSLSEILKIGFPIFQAPMAGVQSWELAVAALLEPDRHPTSSSHFGLPPYGLIERIRSWGPINS